MLIVDDLLFGLPIKGVKWVLGKIAEVADKELTNEEPVMQAILENELALEEGRVDKATYEANQEELMARLREVRTLKKEMAERAAAAAQEEQPQKGPISGKAKLDVELDFGGYGKNA